MAQPVSIVHSTSDFEKSFRRLPLNIRKLAEKKDKLFRENAFDSRLSTHKLKGGLEGYCSYSVNRQYRILFRFLNKNEVIYYDIGTHGIYR